MTIGIIQSISSDGSVGIILTAEGKARRFKYMSGQNFELHENALVPRLTGRHQQPNGFQLKIPAIGDAVVLLEGASSEVSAWGYVEHFVYLLERRHGIRFR